GTDPALGNEIAYSSGSGIVVQRDESLGNRISGNRIVGSGAAELKFDGTGGDVQLPSFPVGGAMTFEAWVKSDNIYSSYARLFDFSDGPGNHVFDLNWWSYTGTMNLGIQDQDNNWSGFTTSSVFPQGQWVHVALTIDGQGNAALYWNGVVEASGL